MTLIMNSDGNHQGISKYMHQPSPPQIQNSSYVSLSQEPSLTNRSLNHQVRQRELSKINSENRRLLERLRQQKSHYNVEKLKERSEKHEQLLRLKSEYPEQYEFAQRRTSTSKSKSLLRSPIRFRNKAYRIDQGRNYFSHQVEQTFDQQTNFAPGEINDSEDEMESLLQQVKSAELEDKRPSHRQPLQQSEGQHEGMLINASGFNSDLKDKPGKGVLTPDDVQLSARMNQTIAHFHSRHESKDRVMPPIVSKDYMTKQEQLTYRQHHDTLEHDQQQVSVIRPLNLKNFEDIETSRVVLYREDYREIFAPPDAKQPGSNFFVIEVSRSRYKLYIVAIKIPKQLLTQVLRGKRNVFNLAQHPRAKVYCLDITEKQAKKLLQECDNDFKMLVDKLYVRQGKLQIRDFDQLMHYGNPESSTVSLQQLNSYRIKNKALEVGGIVITNPDEVYMREQKLKEQYYSKPWRNTSNPPRKQKGFIFQPKETEGSPDPNQSIDQDDMRRKQSSMIVVNGNVMKKHFHRVKNTQQSISVPGKWDVIQSPISTNKSLERSRNEMEKSGNRRYETTQSNATTVQRDEVNTFIDKFIGKQ